MSEAIRQRCEIRYGCTRAAFLLGGYVVKVPWGASWKHFLLGLIANLQERDFSKAGWPQLCPVVWSVWGGWLNVMHRCEPLTQEQWEAFETTVKDGWMVGEEYYVPCEAKPDSFGMFNGRIVALDYGN